MNVLGNIAVIDSKMSCRIDIIEKMLKCSEYFLDKKYQNQEVLNFFTRGHYAEVDMYYAHKINAYWGDVCNVVMTAGENSLLMYMLAAAKEENIGIASVVYDYLLSHFRYQHNSDKDNFDMFEKIFRNWTLQ